MIHAEGGVAHAEEPTFLREVDHQMSPACAAALARYEGSDLLAGGRLALIGLDAIVERFGDRWPARREGVYDLVERALERRLDPDGVILRVSDCDYLVVQPGRGRQAVQIACLTALQELLRHFLGRDDARDVRLCEVTKVSARGLEARPVDPRLLSAPRTESRSFAAAERPTPREAPPIVTAGGQRIQVTVELEPVYCLERQGLIGHRLDRRVRDEVSGRLMTEAEVLLLARADIERIDLAGMLTAAGRLPPAPAHAGLLAPVALTSLACPHGRTLMAGAFETIRERTGRAVVCELIGVEGAPSSVLTEVAGLVRPYCGLVIARLFEPSRETTRAVREAALNGVSLECPHHFSGDAEFIGWARGVITAAKRAARSVLVFGVDGDRRGGMAHLLGATHVGVREVR